MKTAIASRCRIFGTTLGVAMLTVLASAGSSWAQEVDAALRDRVAQLIEKLGAPEEKARDAAEKALIELGPKALPALPDAAKVKSEETKKRLEKVREALKEAEEQSKLTVSKVTIKGEGIRLTEALRQLQSQTSNPISDLREQLGSEVTNPSLDLDIADKTFFEALDIICKKADVVPNFFTGDGSIGLMAAGGDEDAKDKEGPDAKAFVQYVGPFRIVFRQLFATRNLTAGTGTANAQFEVAWEPRIRPMLLVLKADELEIKDDKGNDVEPDVMEESTDLVLRQENPVAELNINMKAPERAAQKLATLHVKGDVTVPSAMRTFKFPSLAGKDVKIKQGDITMVLEDTEVDGQVWKVHVMVQYPGEGPAFESYRQGLFNNRIWLQKADGSRFEHNGGFSNTASDAGKLGFEYLFVEPPGKPGDYQLMYETPSKVITIPLDFTFKDVPLP